MLDEILDDDHSESESSQPDGEKPNRQLLENEINDLTRFSQWASSIGIDTKSRSLHKALEVGFAKMEEMGANRKALIFTESRRTQDYLKNLPGSERLWRANRAVQWHKCRPGIPADHQPLDRSECRYRASHGFP